MDPVRALTLPLPLFLSLSEHEVIQQCSTEVGSGLLIGRWRSEEVVHQPLENGVQGTHVQRGEAITTICWRERLGLLNEVCSTQCSKDRGSVR